MYALAQPILYFLTRDKSDGITLSPWQSSPQFCRPRTAFAFVQLLFS